MEAPCKDKPKVGEVESIKCSERSNIELSHRALKAMIALFCFTLQQRSSSVRPGEIKSERNSLSHDLDTVKMRWLR